MNHTDDANTRVGVVRKLWREVNMLEEIASSFHKSARVSVLLFVGKSDWRVLFLTLSSCYG